MKTYNRKEYFGSLIAYIHFIRRQQMSQLPVRELISLLEDGQRRTLKEATHAAWRGKSTLDAAVLHTQYTALLQALQREHWSDFLMWLEVNLVGSGSPYAAEALEFVKTLIPHHD